MSERPVAGVLGSTVLDVFGDILFMKQLFWRETNPIIYCIRVKVLRECQYDVVAVIMLEKWCPNDTTAQASNNSTIFPSFVVIRGFVLPI
jgi:hypothetical protein